MALASDQKIVIKKSLILASREPDDTFSTGEIRYNSTINKIEAYHKNADVDGNYWRPLTQSIATSSNYGVIKVGNNLNINESSGYISSIASGESRLNQLVITISPQKGYADFDSIVYAISNAIGTPGNNYTDGSLTQTSNLNAAPNSSNTFVLLLSPGRYKEPSQIVLPNFVSLIGDGHEHSIIEVKNTSNKNLKDSAAILSGSNSFISGISVELDANNYSNICGIYSDSKTNVYVKDVNIKNVGTQGATSNCTAIYLNKGENETRIENVMANLNVNGNFNYGIYTNSNNPTIENCKITMNSTNTNTANYGIYVNDSYSTERNTDINYNTINVTGAENNYGVLINNSSVNIGYSIIEGNGDTTNNGYGIAFDSASDANTVSVTRTDISFNFSNSGRNTIVTAVGNFITSGFTPGQSIKITGAGKSNNNNIFNIYDISSTTITLEDGEILDNESAGSSVTIKELFNVELIYSQIKGSTNSLKSMDTNGNYVIDASTCRLLGNNSSIENDTINFTHPQILTVAKKEGDFKLLSSAINSISDNSEHKRYLIRINPGTYFESNPIQCKDYVSIVGFSSESTIINFDLANGTLSAGSCIKLAKEMELNNITIKNITTSGNTTKSSVLYGEKSDGSYLSNVSLNNLNIISSGYSQEQYGIYMKKVIYSSKKVDVIVKPNVNTSGNSTYGWYHNLVEGDNTLSNISVTKGASNGNNYAIYSTLSDINVNFPELLASDGSNNTGFETNNSSNPSPNNLINVNGGSITASTGTNKSVVVGDYTTIICNNVRLSGDTNDSTTESKMLCNNCYEVDTASSVVKLISSHGIREESDLNSISLGLSAGNRDMVGENNTMIGVNSGLSMVSGDNNTFLGTDSGKLNTNGQDNTFLGFSSGFKNVSGDFNTAIGSNTLINLTIGSNNIVVGSNGGYSISSGSNNVIFGNSAGSLITTSSNNTIIGERAGFNTNADDNVIVGRDASYHNISGSNLTIVGQRGGFNLVSGSNVTVLGSYAGFRNTAKENTYIGSHSGYNNKSGIENTMVGFRSGYGLGGSSIGNTSLGYYSASNIDTGSYNVVIGNEAGFSLSSGNKNILIGSKTGSGSDSAGYSLMTGDENIAVGSGAGKSMTEAGNNIMLGTSAGGQITSAGKNILIGKNSGSSIVNNGNNIMIGDESGGDSSTLAGGNCIFMGHNSGKKNSSLEAIAIGNNSGFNISGERNTFIGHNSGAHDEITSGSDNLCIGHNSGNRLTGGSNNIILGGGSDSTATGRQITTGSGNTLIGNLAGSSITVANNNTLIGKDAGKNVTGSNNIALGKGSLGSGSNSGTGNIGIGSESGRDTTDGEYNVDIGYNSGLNKTEGSHNVNIGYEAGKEGTTGTNYNIHVGYKAGLKSNAEKNIFVGYESGVENTSGANNINMGTESGHENVSGNKNINIGSEAGYYNQTGDKNINIGDQAGKGSSGVSINKNIFIGSNSGMNNRGAQNIYIGNTDDSSSIFGIGINTSTQGKKNVFIGSNCGVANTDGNHNVYLGPGAGEMNTEGNFNVNIGFITGQKNTTGDNNINIGKRSGRDITTGSDNIILGNETGVSASSGSSNNILIGQSAGENINQDNLIFIGKEAGKTNTTGVNNIFIGQEAGKTNVTSDDNIFIGYQAGTANTGEDNIFIGSQAGKSTSTGQNNIMIGRKSGENSTTAKGNIFFGSESGQTNILGSYNVGIGYQSLNKFDKNSAISDENGFNISIGYQAGSNIGKTNTLGTYSTPFKNTIMGYQSLSNGDVNTDNIVIGSQSCIDVDSPRIFQKNVMMGTNVGKVSNLSVNSVVIGPNTMTTGTGGEFNIVFGQGCGTKLGNPDLDKISLTDQSISPNQMSVTLNIPYGSATHYYKVGNHIIIDSKETNKYMEDIISAINSISNGGRTEIVFRQGNKSGTTIPSSSIIYVLMKSDTSNIGVLDLTKGSNNTFMGNDSAVNNTIGSRNIAIGDQAMKLNEKGKYNNILGTFAGFNLLSDHNTCFGTKAGFSLDSYSTDSRQKVTDTNYRFYSSNNAIVSDNTLSNTIPFGSVIDVTGSSNNDNRYNVKISDNYSITVDGFPNDKEDGKPTIVSSEATKVENSIFNYINQSYTGTDISFIKKRVPVPNIPGAYYKLIGIKIESLDNYNKFKDAVLIKVSGSKFNDGIKILGNSYSDGSTENIIFDFFNRDGSINYYHESAGNSITLTCYQISLNDNTQLMSRSKNTFNIFNQNFNFYNYFFKDTGLFRVDPDISPINQHTGIGNATLISNPEILNSIQQSSSIKNVDIIFSEGIHVKNDTTVPLPYAFSHTLAKRGVTFDKLNNKIVVNIDNISITYDNLNNASVKIRGSINNDGIYKLSRTLALDSINNTTTLFLDNSTPVKADEELPSGTDLEIIQSSINGNSGLASFLTSNNFVNLTITPDPTYVIDYFNGCFLVDQIDTTCVTLNDSTLLNQIFYATGGGLIKENIIQKEPISLKNNVDVDTYLKSSYNFIFQNQSYNLPSNAVIETNSFGSNLVVNTLYEFADIVVPTMIKVTDSANSSNDGYYLVTKNDHPFVKLEMSHTTPFSTNTTLGDSSTITVDVHSISTTDPNINLSDVISGEEYTVLGAKNNNLVKFKPSSESGTKNKYAFYVDPSTPINEDNEGSIKMSLITNLAYDNSSTSVWKIQNTGCFKSFEYNNLTCDFYQANTTIIFYTTDSETRTKLKNLTSDDYFEIKNHSDNSDLNALYNIVNFDSTSSTYVESGLIKYEVTYPLSVIFANNNGNTATINVNIWSANATSYGVVDAYKMISFMGDNKYLKFSKVTEYDSVVNTNMKYFYVNKSLTFEVVSRNTSVSGTDINYEFNMSNTAIALRETCPDSLIDYNDPAEQYQRETSTYIIEPGQPVKDGISVSDRDLYRNTKGFSDYRVESTIGFDNMEGRMVFYESNSSVKIERAVLENSVASVNYFTYYNNVLWKRNNFSLFKLNDLIQFTNTTFHNNKIYIIKHISDDTDGYYTRNSNGSNIIMKLEPLYNYQSNKIQNETITSGFSDVTMSIPKHLKTPYLSSNTYPTSSDIAASIYRYPLMGSYDGAIGKTDRYNIGNTRFNTDFNTDFKSSNSHLNVTLIGDGISSSRSNSIYDTNNHVILVPTSNITFDSHTKISFANYSNANTYKFYASNSTLIVKEFGDFIGFSKNQYIQISDASDSSVNGYYLTDDTIEPTSTKLVLNSNDTTGWPTDNPKEIFANLRTNTINSSDTATTDLSKYNPGSKLIVSGTTNNNNTFTISNAAITSPASIFIDISSNVTTETPDYCRLEASVIKDETSKLTGSSNIEFHSSNSIIKVNNDDNVLNNFRPGQSITVTNTSSNNNSLTLDSNALPSNSKIIVSDTLTNELNTSATIAKNITITKIGEPIGIPSGSTNSWGGTSDTVNFHYQDAEGNNLMLGSFTGQFSGKKSTSIHNTYIGSKVGQTNHGSGNIFLGSETQLATNENEGATTHDNKFAIYKTNFIGIPSQPLLGGDFATHQLGINTINPGNYVLSTDISTSKTVLVVNGGAIANSFSPFTGTHKIIISNNNGFTPGSIVVSTGNVKKYSTINTEVSVELSSKEKDKKVYGVYSHFEEVNENNQPMYKLDAYGNKVPNPSYTGLKKNVHYCASVGEGCILVTNINGDIENGDYVTTSNIAGYGMKQDSDMLHNYTVAKCTQDIDWDNELNQFELNGKIYKKALISCTYHCG